MRDAHGRPTQTMITVTGSGRPPRGMFGGGHRRREPMRLHRVDEGQVGGNEADSADYEEDAEEDDEQGFAGKSRSICAWYRTGSKS